MDMPPSVTSLMRHKLTVILIMAGTAFTCAIVINIASIVMHRIALVDAPSGLQESAVIIIDSNVTNMSEDDDSAVRLNRLSQYRGDVFKLHNITYVESSAVMSGLPLHGGLGMSVNKNSNINGEGGLQVTAFIGGPGTLNTLGLHLAQGRDFVSSEYIPSDGIHNLNKVSSAIISSALSERLFHTKDVIGSLIYLSGHPVHIVGVVNNLMGMSPRLGSGDNDYGMLLPLEPDGYHVTFVMRAKKGLRSYAIKQAMNVLTKHNSIRIFNNAKTFSRLREEYFGHDKSMIRLLLFAGFSLLVVTTAGVAGLASFWVRQRTRNIGIRRALGATHFDIFCYFHIENFMIMTGGVVVGCMLAWLFNLFLMKVYSLQALSLNYLVVGALMTWLLGQVAVIFPAFRAAMVPPAEALRFRMG